MAKRRDEDSPWKNILRAYFSDAIEFFFPDIADSIDWSVPPEFLDKEFQRLSPNAAIGKRYADQLVRVRLKGGKSLMLLLHLEIQARKEDIFEERMLVYALRIFDFSMYGLAVSPFFATPTTLGDPKKKSSLTKALG